MGWRANGHQVDLLASLTWNRSFVGFWGSGVLPQRVLCAKEKGNTMNVRMVVYYHNAMCSPKEGNTQLVHCVYSLPPVLSSLSFSMCSLVFQFRLFAPAHTKKHLSFNFKSQWRELIAITIPTVYRHFDVLFRVYLLDIHMLISQKLVYIYN